MTVRSILDTLQFCFKTGADVAAKIGLIRLAIASSVAFRHSGLFRRMAADQTTRLYKLQLSNPASVWLRWQDFPMLVENFLYENYRLPIATNISNKALVLDLGGNSGMASLYFAHHYYPNARYVIVEPSEKNLAVLRKNVAGFRADIVAGAVGSVRGEMELEENCIGYNVRLKTPVEMFNEPTDDFTLHRKVPVFTIDDLIEQGGIQQIDLLKMDIEGAEKGIFQFPCRWLTITRAMILEIHGDFTEQHLRNAVEPEGFKVRATRHRAVFWVSRHEDG